MTIAYTTPVIKDCQMDKEMLDELLAFTHEAISNEMTDQDIAASVKKCMTERHPGTWHVFAGRNFGASVTHQENNAAYIYYGQTGLLCFRTP